LLFFNNRCYTKNVKVQIKKVNYKNMDEAQKQAVMGMMCKCGSGKTYAECCGNTACACGSGKMDKDCCMKNAPEAPAAM